MSKCWWCWKPESYAFGLCHTCYRWFYRHPQLDDTDYCFVCNKFITKRNKGGACKECNQVLKITGQSTKRLENLEKKFEDLKPHLDQFSNKQQALDILSRVFKSNELKCLEALLDRYYDHVTLQYIADLWGVSREYVRQCENKAIMILRSKIFNI